MNQTEPETAKFLKKLRNGFPRGYLSAHSEREDAFTARHHPARARSTYFVLRALWPKALKNIFQTNPTA